MFSVNGAPLLLINPLTDSEFRGVVQSVSDHGEQTPGTLEDALRESFPRARVVRGIDDMVGRQRWYVYREGRWVAEEEI